MVGKIVLEALDVATGGIDLNVGPGGSAGTISIGKLGDINIGTLTGTGGITLQAVVGPISITTPKEAELVGVGGVTIGSVRNSNSRCCRQSDKFSWGLQNQHFLEKRFQSCLKIILIHHQTGLRAHCLQNLHLK